MKLFFIGFLQLLFLSSNMYYVSRENYSMIVASAFVANIVFSIAIPKLAFGKPIDRIIYSLGCTVGCVLGVFLSSKI